MAPVHRKGGDIMTIALAVASIIQGAIGLWLLALGEDMQDSLMMRQFANVFVAVGALAIASALTSWATMLQQERLERDGVPDPH